MLDFAQALPAIRAKIAEHMALRGLPREKVLATVVHLLETTLIRVGNDDYAKQNKSYGLTTLRDQHVDGRRLASCASASRARAARPGSLKVKDRRIAKIVKACQDLPGQELFQYLDEDGEHRDVTSADVNAYLREITGRDITAKDFRTWAGNGAGGDGAAGIRDLRQRGQGQEERPRGHRDGRGPARQHADHLPQMLRPPGGPDSYVEGALLLEVKEEVEERTARRPRQPQAGGGGGADPARGEAEADAQDGAAGTRSRSTRRARRKEGAEGARRMPEPAASAREL